MEPDCIEPFSGLLIILNTISISVIIALVVMVVLLISSALISGSEVAFFSISPTQLSELSTTSKQKSNVVLLLEKPKKLLATISIDKLVVVFRQQEFANELELEHIVNSVMQSTGVFQFAVHKLDIYTQE